MRWRGISYIILVMTLIFFYPVRVNSVSYFSEIIDEKDDVHYFSFIDFEFHHGKGKSEIDILKVESRQEAEMISISMTVAGKIDMSGRSTYYISVLTNGDDDEYTDHNVMFSYNGTTSEVHFYRNQTTLAIDNGTVIDGEVLEFWVPQVFFRDAVIFELTAETEQWDSEDLETYMDSTIDLPFDDSGDSGRYYWVYYMIVSLIVIIAIVGFIVNWKFKKIWKRNKARFCLICGGLMQDGNLECRFCGHRYTPIKK